MNPKFALQTTFKFKSCIFSCITMRSELNSIDRFLSADQARKIIARTCAACNSRERHFRMQSVYFGYCQISLNTEKIIILPIFFCKSGGLTQWWCYLAICDKITVVKKFCWGDIIIIIYGIHCRLWRC